MPREVLIEFTAPQELTGVAPGTRALRYGLDADEFCQKKLAIIIDENPPPRHWLLSGSGSVEIGVMSGSQAKMTAAQREGEQEFLRDQIRALDARHASELAERDAKDNVERKKREVSRG